MSPQSKAWTKIGMKMENKSDARSDEELDEKLDEPIGPNQWGFPQLLFLWCDTLSCMVVVPGDHRFSELEAMSCVLDVWGLTHAIQFSQAAHTCSTVIGSTGYPRNSVWAPADTKHGLANGSDWYLRLSAHRPSNT